jgi:hypothetical protein
MALVGISNKFSQAKSRLVAVVAAPAHRRQVLLKLNVAVLMDTGHFLFGSHVNEVKTFVSEDFCLFTPRTTVDPGRRDVPKQRLARMRFLRPRQVQQGKSFSSHRV